jgi:hypothetical protein
MTVAAVVVRVIDTAFPYGLSTAIGDAFFCKKKSTQSATGGAFQSKSKNATCKSTF